MAVPDPPPPHDLLADQSRQNRTTLGQWGMFQAHRWRVGRFLVPRAPGVERLCVLGAGNCNDLDLAWLAEVYREVHLVDIDPAALAGAVERQEAAGNERVRRHAPVDLSGIADLVARWAGRGPGEVEIDACVERLAGPTNGVQDQDPSSRACEGSPCLSGPTGHRDPSQARDDAGGVPAPPGAVRVPGPFDVVLSSCLLSQLIEPVHRLVGKGHLKLGALSAGMRLHHLRGIVDLLAPGGRAVLALDVATSDRCPELARAKERELPDLMRHLLGAGRAFSALDPAVLLEVLRRHPQVAPRVEDVRVSAPWVWHMGVRRCFLVYGLEFRRRRDL